MMHLLSKFRKHIRLTVQIIFTALTNGYVNGYLKGTIYSGTSKQLCVPGLNCYSCPGAYGSCPIGALQSVLSAPKYNFSYYIIGFLLAVGALLGRFVCGWLCPFGLVQDLLYKIPFPKKPARIPGDAWLRYLKYVILGVFVILLPLVASQVAGTGLPWFCKWICPSGTLFAGFPLLTANPDLKEAVGFLFYWKSGILIILLLLSILIYRPFCRYLCPLGAVYGCFNRISVYRYTVDKAACTGCGKCKELCGLGITVHENPNSPECIRCGKCKKGCPVGAIR